MQPESGARAFPVSARIFRIALAFSLTLSALLYFFWSWRWPLVGDASLIHYISFLIERGWAPYRDLGDMNMPGSYMIEIAAMHLFGMGDLAWRIFDFTLLAVASAAFFAITRRNRSTAPSFAASLQSGVPAGLVDELKTPGSDYRWLAALFSASLFILIHGRDGLAQGGQRDLTMAICLIAATAFLFSAVRRRTLWPVSAFGLLSGIAFTIKPTAVLLTIVHLALAIRMLNRSTTSSRSVILPTTPPPDPVILSNATHLDVSPRSLALSAILAYLVAPALALVFLLREHALAAFLAGFHGIIPYYASLGHRPVSFIVLHSVSPLLPIVLIWLAILTLDGLALDGRFLRPHLDFERSTLLAGVLFGLVNCIVQARGLPYYRYPLLVFLLPLMAIDFNRAFDPPQATHLRTRAATCLGIAALSVGGFFLAPQSAILIHRYRWWQTDFITSLERNLNALGGSSLSGHIQCIDSISGCGTVLYRMRLEPSTGVLSDFLLFGPPPGSPDVAIVLQTRERFSAALLAEPPRVIIVTSHLHIDGPDNYQKLDRWPAFAALLAKRYTLQTQWTPLRTVRWWSREETPAGYRIYVLHQQH